MQDEIQNIKIKNGSKYENLKKELKLQKEKTNKLEKEIEKLKKQIAETRKDKGTCTKVKKNKK